MRGSQLNWQAASLFIQRDPSWREKITVGGLWVFVPLIGWPISLGYRKILIAHLRTGQSTLPDWQDWGRYLREGFRSVAVIFLYYSPLYIVVGTLLSQRRADSIPWLWLTVFFSVFTLFLPLLLGAIVTSVFLFSNPPLAIQPSEAIGIFVSFWLMTFLIPSGFLQVSRTGRYLSAFNPRAVVAFVFRNFRSYLEAWVYSAVVSLLAHVWALRYPWTIFWSYQAILYSFNEVLYHEEKKDGHLEQSLFTSFIGRPLKVSDQTVKFRFLGIDLPRMEAR